MTTISTISDQVTWDHRKRRILALVETIRRPETVEGFEGIAEARADAALLLILHVPEVLAEVDLLRQQLARQAPIVEAAQVAVQAKQRDPEVLPGGWCQYNAGLLSAVEDIEKALAPLTPPDSPP